MAQRGKLWMRRPEDILPSEGAGEGVVVQLCVGPEAIAVSRGTTLCAVFERHSLSIKWQGHFSGLPLEWADGTRLLMRVGHRLIDAGVWDSSTGRLVWKAPGDAHLWGDTVVILRAGRELEIRAAQDGKVLDRGRLPHKGNEASTIVGSMLLAASDQEFSGVELGSLRTLWTESFHSVFEGMPCEGVRFRTLLPIGRGQALARFHSNYALITALSGVPSWRRSVPTNHLPVLTESRIGFLFGGSLLLLETASGDVVVEEDHVVPTFWESRPFADGDRMVVVDQAGHIVTINLRNGKVLGIQEERGAQFSRGVAADGRLLVAGLDGSLRVYEAEESTDGEGATSHPMPKKARSGLRPRIRRDNTLPRRR